MESSEQADDFPPAFGDLDVEIGPIAYGTASLHRGTLDEAIDRIETALDCGLTLIDTADVWGHDQMMDVGPSTSETGTSSGVRATVGDGPLGGLGASEQRLGQVLEEVPGLRDRLVLSTKGGIFPPVPYDSSADHLRQACEASLYRLGVEIIDLYQVHEPDLLAHPGEVAEVLSELRSSGKVREVGTSNYRPAQIQALQSYLDFPLVSTQVQCSPLHLAPIHDGTFDIAMELGLTPLLWSPLAHGRLGDEPTSARHRELVAVCDRIATEQGVERSAVVLSWLMHHPAGAIPMIGTTDPKRIRQCAEATRVGLSRQQWYEIYSAARGSSLPMRSSTS